MDELRRLNSTSDSVDEPFGQPLGRQTQRLTRHAASSAVTVSDHSARTHAFMRCPCLSGDDYSECCGPFHRGEAWPPTAERLMRSRYSAFAVGDGAYLMASWHPDTRPVSLELELDVRWYRLDIVGRTAGGLLDSTGSVDFRAYWRAADGTAGVQAENSRFARVDRRWVYLGEA